MKYLKFLVYGVMPAFALMYLINIIYDLTVFYGEPLSIYRYFNIVELLICILAAVLLSKQKKTGLILLDLAAILGLARTTIGLMEDLSFAKEQDDIINLISYTFGQFFLYGILLIGSTIYLLKSGVLSKKVAGSTGATEKTDIESEETVEAGKSLESVESSTTDEVSSKPLKKGAIIGGSLLLAFALIYITTYEIRIANDLYYIFCESFARGKKLSLLQQQNVSLFFSTLSNTLEFGAAFYVAWLFNKMEVLDYNDMAFTRSRKPVISLLKGFGVAIVLTGLIAIALKALGCGFSFNKLPLRVYPKMLASAITFIGVGFFEEITMRGVLLGYCEKHKLKVWGIVLSTFIFTILHYITGAYTKPVSAIFLASGGILYAVLKLNKSNLFVAIGCHALYDWSITHFLEARLLNNKESVFSVLKNTYTKQSWGIAIPSLIIAAVILIVKFAKSKKTAVEA